MKIIILNLEEKTITLPYNRKYFNNKQITRTDYILGERNFLIK